MKFDNLKIGQELFDVGSSRMGNTTMRTICVWSVYVREIDTERRRALCSWNGNPPSWYSVSEIAKLKENEPYLIRTNMGGRRRPTREELAAHRANLKAEAQS